MSKVKVKTKSCGEIRLGNMSQSNEIKIDENQLILDFANPENPSNMLTADTVVAFSWTKTMKKPDTVQEAFRQICALFNVGKEVDGYSVYYFPPAVKKEKGYEHKTFSLVKAEFGAAARMILVLGTREMLYLSASGAGMSGEGKILINKNWCHSLPLGFCSQCVLTFNNSESEALPSKKGFRAGNRMKKDPTKRHILVFDLSTSSQIVTERIQRELAAAKSGPKLSSDAEDALSYARTRKTTVIEETSIEETSIKETRGGAGGPALNSGAGLQSTIEEIDDDDDGVLADEIKS